MSDEITREKADEMLIEWAEWLDLYIESKLFKALSEQMNYLVRTKKLDFNLEEEFFNYKLIKPIDGIEVIQIQECDFKSKKALDRYKDNEGVLAAIAMLSKYTNLTFQQAEKLKDRDVSRIGLVISFLAQTSAEK